MSDELHTDIAYKITRNSISNITRGLLTLPILFLITPYMLNKLGISMYGTWMLITTFINFAGLADFGIGASLTKYVAEYSAKKDYDELNRFVNTAVGIYFLFSAVVFPLSFLLIKPILVTFFNVQSYELLNQFKIIFIGSLFIFLINLVFSGYFSILGGLQRYDIANIINIIMAVLNAIGVLFFLSLGLGIWGLLLNNGIIMIVTVITNLVVIKCILPQIIFNPLLFSVNKIRTIIGYGIKVFTSSVASLIHFQIDKLLIAYFLNIKLVGYYQIASELVTHIRNIPILIISPIMPAATELYVMNDSVRLKELYLRSQKYNIFIALPLFAVAFILADPFINLWLGVGYNMTSLALRFLIIANFANVLTGPGFLILNAIGKPQYGMYSSVFAAISNLILSILFIRIYGYIGVLWGTALSMIIAAGYFKYMFHQVMRICFSDMVKETILYPGLAVVSASLTICLLFQIYRISLTMSLLIMSGLLFIILYISLVILFKHFDEFDKTLLKKVFTLPGTQ